MILEFACGLLRFQSIVLRFAQLAHCQFGIGFQVVFECLTCGFKSLRVALCVALFIIADRFSFGIGFQSISSA